MKNKLNHNRVDRIFDTVNMACLIMLLIAVLYPLIYVLSCSFSSASTIVSGKVWLWPVGFTLDGYKAVFNHSLVLSGFRNSFLYAVAGTVFVLFMNIIAAYPLSRRDFYGRNVFMGLFVFTMFFHGGLIPTYLLMKDLGLINKWLIMVIPGALSAWNVIVMRTYFQNSVPVELLEAAKMDGCSDIKYLWRILIPLSKPILAVMALFSIVGHWNSYFGAMIYLNDTRLYPLQLVLRSVLVSSQIDSSSMQNIDVNELTQRLNTSQLLKYSLIIVSSVPVLAIYPFVQKHFVKGMLVGSLKG